mgnify:CR=1 FL=1
MGSFCLIPGMVFTVSGFFAANWRNHSMNFGFVFFFNSILLGIGLAMDAFSVSLANGLNEPAMRRRKMCLIAGVFGFFQALMPIVGYLLAKQFASFVVGIDHWIAFALLVLIGANMIREAVKNEEENLNDSFSPKTMLPLAVATSIDALAVGVTFAFLDVSIVPAVSMIGATTFILSAVGVKIGNVFGAKYKSKAELVGGIVLIAMGVKILIEHLFFD